jgi:hypothetical protein
MIRSVVQSIVSLGLRKERTCLRTADEPQAGYGLNRVVVVPLLLHSLVHSELVEVRESSNEIRGASTPCLYERRYEGEG